MRQRRGGGGREAVKRGQAFEAQIEAANLFYHRAGLARVEHYGPAIKIFGRSQHDGRLQVVLAGKAPPDYVGVLSGGRYVAFEAKSAAAKHQTTLTQRLHQFTMLDEMERVAGTGLFGYLQYWRNRPDEKVTWHPITSLSLQGFPEKVVIVHDEGIVVPDHPQMRYVPDWLAVVVPELRGRNGV